MAYFTQENKKAIAPVVKAICKKFGVNATLSVRNNSEVVLTINSGKIDFFTNVNEISKERAESKGHDFFECKTHMQVNTYWMHEHFSGVARDFLLEVHAAMNTGNHNNSDSQTDYFDVGFYTSINIGRWNKAYEII